MRNYLLVGLILMAVGQMLFAFTKGYGDLLLYRSITGIGMGICVPVYAVLVMENFPENERPVVNTIYSALPYIATFMSLYTIVPLLYRCGGSWRVTLAVFGLMVAFLAVLWFVCLPKIISPDVSKGSCDLQGSGDSQGSADSASPGDSKDSGDSVDFGEKSTGALLAEVAHDREVRLLCVADIADMWGYNFLTSFLPTYFQLEVGMSISDAANMTAIFPVAGVIAGLACGALMSRIGLRKPFTWPSHLLVFAGTLLMVLFSGPVRIVGIILAGVGNAAWAPALFTMPMEFEGMTSVKAGAAFSFIFGIGYIAAFISPLVGGWMGDVMSLKAALIFNSFVALVAAAATFMMKETGPRRRKAVPAETTPELP